MRILATAQPAIGHLNPIVPLLCALQDAGHEVRVATAALAAPWVEAAGLTSVPAGLNWLETRYAETFPEVVSLRADPAALNAFLMDVFTRRTAVAMTRDLLATFADWEPDLVLHEKAELGGAAAAVGAGVPHLPLWYSANDWYGLFVPHLAGCDEALVAAGAVPKHGDPDWITEHGAVLIEPPGWTVLPDSVRTWRVRPEPFEGTVEAVSRPAAWYASLPRPVVLVTLGTVFNKRPGLFEPLIRGALAHAGTVVVTTGPGASITHDDPRVIIEEFLPLSQLLPHCDAVVGHAGYGTVIGCAATATPMVAIVIGADHTFNAAGAVEAGWAVALATSTPTAGAVADALARCLSPTCQRAAGNQRDGLEALPTAAAVAELLAGQFGGDGPADRKNPP